jgi:hypothetical protein
MADEQAAIRGAGLASPGCMTSQGANRFSKPAGGPYYAGG